MREFKKNLSLTMAILISLTLVTPTLAQTMVKPGEYSNINTDEMSAAVIDENGSLWMWGNNEFGQLGTGTMENSTVPVKVLDNVVTVSCSGTYTAAIKADGSLWMWGDNSFGELGNGGGANSEGSYGIPIQNLPVKVMDDVKTVSCGENHTAAIKTDGSLWTWGYNTYGQLGNGSSGENSAVPKKVMDSVAAVSCAGYYTAAIKTDGTLWTWGDNGCGQLGNGGGGNDEIYFVGTPIQTSPLKIMDHVAAVSCVGYVDDSYYTAAIKTDGTLWMWGSNSTGQIGNAGGGNAQKTFEDEFFGGTITLQTTPVQVLDNVTAVSFGGRLRNSRYTAALKTDGSLWTWGCNDFGKLGTDVEEISTVPVKVLDDVVAFDCGEEQTAAIKKDGTLWMWGGGAIGNGSYSSNTSTPVKVLDNAMLVSCSSGYSVAVKNDGTLWTWGGMYGTGSMELSLNPIQVKGLTISASSESKPTQPQQSQQLQQPTTSQANPTNDKLTVNDVLQTPTVYKINDYNYFKIRDLAAALNGTSKQFGVGYDGATNSVTATKGQPYEIAGGELAGAAEENKTAEISNDVIYVDGVRTEVEVYKIDGSNYFKLRDLGDALGFDVGWTAEKGIFINTEG